MIINIHFFASLISVLFLIVLLFWLYRDYRIDKFRQEMFKLRDELFNEVAKNNLLFEDNSYELIRNTINGFIRFAHKINLIQALFYLYIFKKQNNYIEPFSAVFDKSMACLSLEQRKILKSYYIKMNFLIIEHLILSSPLILFTVLIPIMFVLLAKDNIENLVKTLKSPLDKLDSAALTTGTI